MCRCSNLIGRLKTRTSFIRGLSARETISGKEYEKSEGEKKTTKKKQTRNENICIDVNRVYPKEIISKIGRKNEGKETEFRSIFELRYFMQT